MTYGPVIGLSSGHTVNVMAVALPPPTRKVTGTMTMPRRSILGLMGAAPVATTLALTPVGAALADTGRSRPGRIPADLRPGGAFDRFVAGLAAQDEFSGTLLLTHRGRTVLSRSYGLADKEREIPNEADTIFGLASVTKLFTAVAIAQLAQQDEVDFHDEVGAYVDGLPTELAATATIHHLLTHTSGLGDHMMETEGYLDVALTWTSVEEVWNGNLEFIRQHAATPRPFPPGGGSNYSNAGYFLLGVIVERASGQPYYDYIREHIFGAAGMSRSDFYTTPEWRDDPRIAHPYRRGSSGAWEDTVDQKPFIGNPGGEAHATCADMDRFARALLADPRDGGLLHPAYRQLVLSGKVPRSGQPGGPHPPESAAPSDPPDDLVQQSFMCYGPSGALLNGHWAFGHAGGAPGVSTYIEIYPDREWVAVMLSNYQAAVEPVAQRARQLINAD